ncbi:hypothetical protein AOLI_G00076990 [Acnodon oligacanthus]
MRQFLKAEKSPSAPFGSSETSGKVETPPHASGPLENGRSLKKMAKGSRDRSARRSISRSDPRRLLGGAPSSSSVYCLPRKRGADLTHDVRAHG